MWLPELSTFVEHQAASPSELPRFVQHLMMVSWNMKGNLHGLFGSGPEDVVHPNPEQSYSKSNERIIQ